MVNFSETLFAIAIVSLVIAGLAYVQSRSGGEREVRYRTRMRRFLILAIVSGLAAGILEVGIRL